MDHMQEFLKEWPLFRSSPQIELSGLIEKSRLKTFAPHEVIINFGQPGGFCGIICDGEAEAVVPGKLGERKRPAWMFTQATCGILAYHKIKKDTEIEKAANV